MALLRRPPTGPRMNNTTINHYIRKALCLADVLMWLVEADCCFLLIESRIESDTLFCTSCVAQTRFFPLIGTQNEFWNLPFTKPEYFGVVYRVMCLLLWNNLRGMNRRRFVVGRDGGHRWGHGRGPESSERRRYRGSRKHNFLKTINFKNIIF